MDGRVRISGAAVELPAADPLSVVEAVGDGLGDDQRPRVPPKPQRIRHLGDDPGLVADGDW